MLLTQLRFDKARVLANHARQTYKDLTSSDLMDLGYIIIVADLEMDACARRRAKARL